MDAGKNILYVQLSTSTRILQNICEQNCFMYHITGTLLFDQGKLVAVRGLHSIFCSV